MCGYNQVKRKPILTLFFPFTATFFAVGRATRRTKKLARQNSEASRQNSNSVAVFRIRSSHFSVSFSRIKVVLSLHLDSGKLSDAVSCLSDTANGRPADIYHRPKFIYMNKQIASAWTGSEKTSDIVRRQIRARWGEEEAGNYDPKSNCLTFRSWLKNGFKVRKGEKALKSFIVIEEKDKKGEVVRKYPKSINLFYVRQVEKFNQKTD